MWHIEIIKSSRQGWPLILSMCQSPLRPLCGQMISGQEWRLGIGISSSDTITTLGQSDFDERFAASSFKIIRRTCPNCDSDFQDIYYRRRGTSLGVLFQVNAVLKATALSCNACRVPWTIMNMQTSSMLQKQSVCGKCSYNIETGERLTDMPSTFSAYMMMACEWTSTDNTGGLPWAATRQSCYPPWYFL